jgi:hypothetical protein
MERRPPTHDGSKYAPPAPPPPYEETGAGTPARTTTRPFGSRQATASRQARAVPITINSAIGAWLFLSAFLWPHAGASFTNTWVVGLLLAISGILAQRMPMARSMCGLLGLWLVVSTLFIVPLVQFTFWHNLLLGIAVLAITFMPSVRARARRVT